MTGVSTEEEEEVLVLGGVDVEGEEGEEDAVDVAFAAAELFGMYPSARAAANASEGNGTLPSNGYAAAAPAGIARRFGIGALPVAREADGDGDEELVEAGEDLMMGVAGEGCAGAAEAVAVAVVAADDGVGV